VERYVQTAVRDSVAAHIEVLSDACRSLQHSVSCFSFTDSGERELREREKGKKKWQISWGYVTLLPVVPGQRQKTGG
jgi:hypothetical protein